MRFFGILLLLSISLCAQRTVDQADFFDKPVMEVVDFGPSPYYASTQHVRKKLTCYVYPTFMVKQYDEGQKGAEWLSFVPFQSKQRPKCSLTHTKNEQLITWKDAGYFWGAKDSFAFFEAPDGVDGGVPFAVYDTRTGKKIFEDSSVLETILVPESAKLLRIAHDHTQQIVLSYLRVVEADCNVAAQGAKCWSRVRTNYAIPTTKVPSCSNYENNADLTWVSAVGNPVSVVISDHPQITALDGPTYCWPVD